jgi:CelD/BcsL family acetyltransferase involved in cellulose biosynthesis
MPTIARPMADRLNFAVERISDEAAFAHLKPEWSQLLKLGASGCLFLTWEWLYTWWKHLAANRQLAILAVRCADELTAVAPFCIRPPSLSRRCPFPVLEFLGSGYVGSDYLDFIIHKDYEPEVLTLLASHLRGERLVFDWAQLKRCGSHAAEVAFRLREEGWRISETGMSVSPFIPLAGKSWESYLATLGAEHRYNFHRKWKRLNKDYVVQFEQVRTDQQCREAIDLLISLHNLRWNERGGSDAFHTPDLVEFHREFSRIALEHGWLRLYILRLNGKPAASLYGFLYGRTFYFYQSGFDPSYAKYSVGLVTMGLAIENAISEGAEEYDLLHGNEDYKSHWSCDSRELRRLSLYPPGNLGLFYRSSAEFERASRTIARRLLPKSIVDGIRTKWNARQGPS